MHATNETLKTKAKAETYADLAKFYVGTKHWQMAQIYAAKARAEWLRVQWYQAKTVKTTEANAA